MKHNRIGLVFALLATAAVWGCAQSGAEPGMAAKANRLQEEVKSLSTLSDQLRKDLRLARVENEAMQGEMQTLREELRELRDKLAAAEALKLELAERTAERDAAIGQLHDLRRNVRNLVQQLSALAPAEGAPVIQASLPGAK